MDDQGKTRIVLVIFSWIFLNLIQKQENQRIFSFEVKIRDTLSGEQNEAD